MNATSSYTVISSTPEGYLINSSAGTTRFWQFHNRGPAKVSLRVVFSAGEDTYELRPGDHADFNCIAAQVQLAAGESYDSAIIEWQPRIW